MFENEERVSALFKELVPFTGKADTVAGEIIRAVSRLGYRFTNDGDHIGIGYGKETCNASARYLAAKCKGEVSGIIQNIWGVENKRLYQTGMQAIIDSVLGYLDKHPELKETKNEEDMLDYDQPEDYEDDEEDWDEDDWEDDDVELDDADWTEEDIFEYAIEELNQLCWDRGFNRYNLTVTDYLNHKTTKEGLNLAPDTLQILFDLRTGEYDWITVIDEDQDIDICIPAQDIEITEIKWGKDFISLNDSHAKFNYLFKFFKE